MFEKVKECFDAKVAAIAGGSGAAIIGVCAPTLAFADDPTIASTLTTGVTGAVTQAQDAIMAVLPQALVLMGVILGITVGVRLFRRIGQGRG